MTLTEAKDLRKRRARTIALWALQVLAAGFFLLAAGAKLTGAEPSASTFEAIGWGDWFRTLVGVLEIAGVVALFVPLLAGLAALAFTGLMAGAVVTEAFVTGGGVVMPLVLLVLSAVIAWGRRDSVARLWTLLTQR
jgi:uncharacterized membrane protein YphA (DoxX/SURF4 family)